VAGLGLGLLATRVLSFIVYQATPKDPLVLGGVTLTMLLLGLLAALLPARRPNPSSTRNTRFLLISFTSEPDSRRQNLPPGYPPST
jgi:hypothetical protein